MNGLLRWGQMASWIRNRKVQAACLTLLLVATTLPARAQTLTLTSDVSSDADWIMSARLPDGAIANYVDRQAVWPYLSNFAAMGLAKATTVTRNNAYVAAAWTWLSWYQAHMDATGFVTDYRMSNGVLTSTNDMDSTDAYAGTFLLAAREAYRATSDLTTLKTLTTGISKAVQAIEATQDTDGLTWAKPSWHVKYLMDQAETFAGLLAAVDLANLLKNSTLANRAQSDANRMKTGVANIWNTTTLAFDWAVHDTGARTATDWTLLYSDALQQAWAVAFGIVDSTRASSLITKFTTSQPNWQYPNKTALFSGGSQGTVGYWPVAGFGLNALKSSSAGAAAVNIRAGALANNRAWPFTTGNAGQLILFESGFSLPLLVTTSPANKLQTRAGTALYQPTVSTVARRIPTPVTTTVPPIPPTTAPAKPTPTVPTIPSTTTTTKPPLALMPVPGGPTVTVPSP